MNKLTLTLLLALCLTACGCESKPNHIEWEDIARLEPRDYKMYSETILSVPFVENTMNVHSAETGIDYICYQNGTVVDKNHNEVTDIKPFAKAVYEAIEIVAEQGRKKYGR